MNYTVGHPSRIVCSGHLPVPVVIGLVFLTIYDLPLPTAFAQQEREEVVDADQDGKPEEWRYYRPSLSDVRQAGGPGPQAGLPEELVKVQRDRDGDGKREVTIFFEAGRPARSEVDRNGDSTPDLVRWMKEGRSDRERGDLNFDGKWDAWVFYKEGLKDLMIMDRNHDGKPDAYFYYGQAGLKLIGGKVDENFDGTPDRSFGAVPEKEERQPW